MDPAWKTNHTSPEDEPGPSCSSVDADFLEWTVLYLISQHEFNNLVTDITLSDKQAELLASRLQGWNFYSRVLNCRTGNTSNCHHFFSKDCRSVYCNDVEGLPQELGYTHNQGRPLGGASGALAPGADFEGAPERQSPTGHTLIRSTVAWWFPHFQTKSRKGFF
jgi:hypothetical protein